MVCVVFEAVALEDAAVILAFIHVLVVIAVLAKLAMSDLVVALVF